MAVCGGTELHALVVNAANDAAQVLIDFSATPLQTQAVLAHLQAGHRHPARVRGLARSVQHILCRLYEPDGLGGRRHVGAFRDTPAAVLYQMPGIIRIDFVLRGTGKGQVAGYLPGALALVVSHITELPRILLDAPAAAVLEVHDPLQFVHRQSFRVVHEPPGVRHGHYLATHADQLFRTIGGHIPRAGDHTGFALDALLMVRQHFLHHVHRAVTGGFRADTAAAKFQRLAREHAFKAIHNTLVLTKHVAHFAPAHADITRRDVGIRADVFVKLGHESLAEAHNLALTLALGVEIGTALAATHGQTGQTVLEHLLEGEELQHRLVDRGMEANTALVGANRIVLLYTEAPVDADLAVVVFPHYPEGHDTVRFGHTLQNFQLLVNRLVRNVRHNIHRHFVHRLGKLGFPRVAALNFVHESGEGVGVLCVHCRDSCRLRIRWGLARWVDPGCGGTIYPIPTGDRVAVAAGGQHFMRELLAEKHHNSTMQGLHR